jgi:hypothetical protein
MRFVPEQVCDQDPLEVAPLSAPMLLVASKPMAASDTEANTIVAAIKTPTIHPMPQP